MVIFHSYVSHYQRVNESHKRGISHLTSLSTQFPPRGVWAVGSNPDLLPHFMRNTLGLEVDEKKNMGWNRDPCHNPDTFAEVHSK